MKKIDINLEKAKQMFYKIDNNNIYMRIYPFTTENINAYLQYFDLKNKSLLTIGSSGDQILNAYLKGCKDITLIDINPFSKYYINLKIASILALTYQEFQALFYYRFENIINSNRFNINILKKVYPILKKIDYDSYYFFNELFNIYPTQQIINYLLNDDQKEFKVINKINNYLNNDESYNKLKKILKDISFNYINQDIYKFNSNNKYDNIFLSNLCTCTTILNLKELLIKLDNNNIKKYGSMLIAYLWNIDYFYNEFEPEWKEIYRMPATRDFLKEFITEYHSIEGINDIIFDRNKESDLVLIYRK